MPFPAYTRVTRDDVSAIWAYLRTLEPVRNEVQPNQLRFPFNVRRPATSTWDLINFKPGVFQSDPAKSELWNRAVVMGNSCLGVRLVDTSILKTGRFSRYLRSLPWVNGSGRAASRHYCVAI
jgi:hypothetical protein